MHNDYTLDNDVFVQALLFCISHNRGARLSPLIKIAKRWVYPQNLLRGDVLGMEMYPSVFPALRPDSGEASLQVLA